MLVYEGDQHVRPFVFIHIQKTGGISIQEAIRERVEAEHPGPKHVGAARIRNILSGSRANARPFNEYYRFAFVRNPYERLVSWYSMIAHADEIKSERFKNNPLWQYAAAHGETFEQFVRECVEPAVQIKMRGNATYSFAQNQLDYLRGQKGAMLVDTVGRFENFATDFRRIFSEIGFSAPEVPHRNASKKGAHYREWYTPETREIVAGRFAKDIEHFGYSF